VLRPGAATIERTVLDETPRHFARLEPSGIDVTQRWMWTTGGGTIGRHDLVEPYHAHHDVASGTPGDFVVVADAQHPDRPGGAWLAVFVHEPSSPGTELRVIDAADPAAAPIATVHISRSIPRGLRCTWMPEIEP
jgi:carotenoid cleavage dioxygenase-like enzyme